MDRPMSSDAPGTLPRAQGADGVQAPPSKGRPRRGCLMPVLLVLVFLFGGICGAGVSLGAVRRALREAVEHPERRPERTAERLARRLGLSTEQRRQVQAVLAEQQAEFRRLRIRAAPEIAARLRKTDREIAAVLTPEQRERWRTMVEDLRRNWLPLDLRERFEEEERAP